MTVGLQCWLSMEIFEETRQLEPMAEEEGNLLLSPLLHVFSPPASTDPQQKHQRYTWGFDKPWQAKSSETVRHIKSSGYRVVRDGAIDPTGWPDTDDWYGVKSWVANGFYMNFTNKSYDDSASPDKEAALTHSFYVDIDITVKENEEGGISL